jgi:hypothetical protein
MRGERESQCRVFHFGVLHFGVVHFGVVHFGMVHFGMARQRRRPGLPL